MLDIFIFSLATLNISLPIYSQIPPLQGKLFPQYIGQIKRSKTVVTAR